jgi:signal transduction histidine kinase
MPLARQGRRSLPLAGRPRATPAGHLVRNAIRNAPDGTSIDITLNGSPLNASVSIRDYGAGIPADSLTAIFKPFFRLDRSRDTASGGVGLGLAIAQRAIQVHNGEVWAQNASLAYGFA